jgi:hypothetical protein
MTTIEHGLRSALSTNFKKLQIAMWARFGGKLILQMQNQSESKRGHTDGWLPCGKTIFQLLLHRQI